MLWKSTHPGGHPCTQALAPAKIRHAVLRFMPALVALMLLVGSNPPRTRADAADGGERFFGAVQAIYNPDRARQAGVQWERLIFPWSLIQKDGPNSWANGYFSDQQIKDEIARGIQVVGLAIYTPQWASTTPATGRTINVPANLYLPFDDPQNYWGQFMFKLAQRYAGQIDTWVIWNEPDVRSDTVGGYTWDGTVTDFYQLVKVGYLAIKKANPNARVALPGMTYWWDKEGGRPLYLARFLEVAALDPSASAHGRYFDIVVLHQYSNPLNTFAAVQVLRRAMATYGVDRPIWINESNVAPYNDPLAPITPVLHATLDQQASYIIQAFAVARAAGVERMSVYKMVDERTEGPGELFGLVRNDGSIRPAFTAFQTAVRYMSAPTSVVYTWEGASDPPTDDEVTRLLQSNAQQTQWIWPAAVNRVTLERGPERVTVVWNASPRLVSGHIPAVAKSAQVIDKFGRDTGEAVARDGQYSLELYPTENDSDPRDPGAYLVGGDPRLLVERVAPLPAAVEAPIQTVWRKDPRTVNITAVLLLPSSLQPVPCRWNPTVRLFAAIDGGATTLLSKGERRIVVQDGLTYPVWDFNNVDITASLPARAIEFWVDVDGIATRATRWAFNPMPPATPTPTATPAPVVSDVADEDVTTALPTPTPPASLEWQQRPTSTCQ